MAGQRGTFPELGGHFLEAFYAQEITLFVRQHFGENVDVRVVETRQHHLPDEIDDLGLCDQYVGRRPSLSPT